MYLETSQDNIVPNNPKSTGRQYKKSNSVTGLTCKKPRNVRPKIKRFYPMQIKRPNQKKIAEGISSCSYFASICIERKEDED
jgi:hypothetical protein